MHGGMYCTIIYYTIQYNAAHAARAGIVLSERCHARPRAAIFIIFVPTFLRQEFGSCVQKKGTTAMQVVAVKSDIFKGITAIAEGQYFDSPGGLLKEGF